eukprot:Gb_15442 [translate_table: standard]
MEDQALEDVHQRQFRIGLPWPAVKLFLVVAGCSRVHQNFLSYKWSTPTHRNDRLRSAFFFCIFGIQSAAQSMDFIFYLDDNSRSVVMRMVVRMLGWTHIVIWSLEQNIAPHLVCKDGWYNSEMEAGPSSMTESIGLRLFNAYKLCRFAPEAGVPGLALNASSFIWLALNELLNLSSVQAQREFYRLNLVQTVVFIPCESGVIELGTTNMVRADEQIKISSLLTEDIIRRISLQRPPASTLPMEQGRPSSSSSSLISRSIDSPETSSLGTLQGDQTKDADREFLAQLSIPHSVHQFIPLTCKFAPPESAPLHIPPSLHFLQIPSITGVEVITPGITEDCGQEPRSHEISIQPTPEQLQKMLELPSVSNIRRGAFGRWRSSTRRLQTRTTSAGQYMFKKCLDIWRNIYAETLRNVVYVSGIRSQSTGTGVSSSQVHHMISERKRREKLKESFQALRSLLPPSTRKDKASVLASTREYLGSLLSRVEELNKRNQQLESLISAKGGGTEDTPPETSGTSPVTVQISELQNTPSEMEIRLVVQHPSNTIDFIIALLNSLRQMGVDIISIRSQDETSQTFRATVRIKIQEASWNASKCREVEEGIKKALSENNLLFGIPFRLIGRRRGILMPYAPPPLRQRKRPHRQKFWSKTPVLD